MRTARNTRSKLLSKVIALILTCGLMLGLIVCSGCTSPQQTDSTPTPTASPTPEPTPSPEPTPTPGNGDDETSTENIIEMPPFRDITAAQAVSEMVVGNNFWGMGPMFYEERNGYAAKGFIPYEMTFILLDRNNNTVLKNWNLETPNIGETLTVMAEIEHGEGYTEAAVIANVEIQVKFNIAETVGEPYCKFSIDNAKLTLKNGDVIELDGLNRTYNFSKASFTVDDGTHFFIHQIQPQLPEAQKLDGAVFSADITLLDINEPSKSNWDYLDFGTRSDYGYTGPVGEAYWQPIVDAFADKGFNVFRLPLVVTPYVRNDTFEMDIEYLDAVKIYVDYILEKVDYLIIEPHDDYMNGSWVEDRWEVAWMKDEYSEYVNARFTEIWRQLATYFKDYSEKLIFETFNEPSMDGETVDWWTQENIDLAARRVNEMNMLFYDTVRGSGGNNDKRLLILPGIVWCKAEYLSYSEFPGNDDHIIAVIHEYPHDTSQLWGSDAKEKIYEIFRSVDEFMTDRPDIPIIDEIFHCVDEFMADHADIPIIVGETGCIAAFPTEVRQTMMQYFIEESKQRGIPVLYWSGFYFYSVDHFTPEDDFGLYYWDTREWHQPELAQTIIDTSYEEHAKYFGSGG